IKDAWGDLRPREDRAHGHGGTWHRRLFRLPSPGVPGVLIQGSAGGFAESLGENGRALVGTGWEGGAAGGLQIYVIDKVVKKTPVCDVLGYLCGSRCLGVTLPRLYRRGTAGLPARYGH